MSPEKFGWQTRRSLVKFLSAVWASLFLVPLRSWAQGCEGCPMGYIDCEGPGLCHSRADYPGCPISVGGYQIGGCWGECAMYRFLDGLYVGTCYSCGELQMNAVFMCDGDEYPVEPVFCCGNFNCPQSGTFCCNECD